MRITQNVKYLKELPSVAQIAKLAQAPNLILICDEKLKSHDVFRSWAVQFKNIYAVSAGEKLKDLAGFSAHVEKVLPMLSGYSPSQSVIVAVGGGSVGDFSGFLASVLKRGVRLVHVPTTWLAAMDSSHGGKTALNVGNLKNQVGTFYHPHVVLCIQSLLRMQPEENLRSAFGEILKMALIDRKVFAQLECMKTFDQKCMWKILPVVVAAKYKVVKRDPREEKGIRQILNLGHTLGHAFELEKMMPHGLAVQVGLEFATEWSYRKKILPQSEYLKLKKLYSKNQVSTVAPVESSRLHYLLKQDKKAIKGDSVGFVFIRGPGKVIVKAETVDNIVRAAKELGWAK